MKMELLDGVGNKILDGGLNPVEIPAFREINIYPQGEIFVQPIGAEPDALPQNVATIATYVPSQEDNLKKTLDGHIRIESEPNEEGLTDIIAIEPNQQAKIVSGFIEKATLMPLKKWLTL